MRDWQWVSEVVGVEKVTDGDTFWLRLDVGFRQQQLTEVRLLGFDTPELYRPKSDLERDKAREAKGTVETWFDDLLPLDSVSVWVRTEKDPDSFGRWLGEVFALNAEGEQVSHLGEFLVSLDLASRWPTRWRDQFDVT